MDEECLKVGSEMSSLSGLPLGELNESTYRSTLPLLKSGLSDLRLVGEKGRLQRLHLLVDRLCRTSESLAREILSVSNREVHNGELLSVHVRSTAEIPARIWEGNGLLVGQSIYRLLKIKHFDETGEVMSPGKATYSSGEESNGGDNELHFDGGISL